MPVRAKCVCNAITVHEDGGRSVYMHPVHSGSDENKAFNDATPGGEIRLHIAKDKPAAEQFERGREYFVDFTLVG